MKLHNAQVNAAVVAGMQRQGESEQQKQQFARDLLQAGAVARGYGLNQFASHRACHGEQDAQAKRIEAPESQGRQVTERDEQRRFEG
jgi:hypothetical protein